MGHKNSTVLVIDDDHDTAELIACFLCRANFRPVIASSGKDGVQHAHTLLPAMILCDSCMPEMDGLAVIEALRANPATARIPIVLMSAHKPARFDGSEANAFLAKPFHVSELLATVQSLVNSAKVAPAKPKRSAKSALECRV
jgi:DNA-binding response OmpR family regulator